MIDIIACAVLVATAGAIFCSMAFGWHLYLGDPDLAPVWRRRAEVSCTVAFAGFFILMISDLVG